MSALAVFLIATTVADFCRRAVRVAWPSLAIGPIVVLVCAALGALWRLGDVVVLAIAAAAVVVWEWLCRRSENSGTHQVAPLAGFAAAVALLIVLSGWSSAVNGVVARWSAWAHLPLNHVTPTRLLMVVAVVLLQFATGNQLVRLVLGSVGAVRPAGEPQPSDRLKGGRLLGPMERLLIGEPRRRRTFLVGSFTSWLLALGGIALVVATR